MTYKDEDEKREVAEKIEAAYHEAKNKPDNDTDLILTSVSESLPILGETHHLLIAMLRNKNILGVIDLEPIEIINLGYQMIGAGLESAKRNHFSHEKFMTHLAEELAQAIPVPDVKPREGSKYND